MAVCCICGRKIGSLFGEDKIELEGGLQGCYQCASLFDKIRNTDEIAQIEKAKNEIREKMEKNNVSQIVYDAVENEYKKIHQREKALKERQQAAASEQADFAIKRSLLMATTGYNFEGYRITQYLDIVHGEYSSGALFCWAETALSRAKYMAQEQMMKMAISRGANAVIGINFDISVVIDNIMVATVTGTAVVVEKI